MLNNLLLNYNLLNGIEFNKYVVYPTRVQLLVTKSKYRQIYYL